MYNIYGIEMYPTAVSGLGNGFMKSMGALSVISIPYTINVNISDQMSYFIVISAGLIIVAVI